MRPTDANKQGHDSRTEGPNPGRKPEGNSQTQRDPKDAGQDNRGKDDVDGNRGQQQDGNPGRSGNR